MLLTLARVRGSMTKAFAESTGMRTPNHACGAIGPQLWFASGVELYGCPYPALVVVPASSPVAVVTKSTGSACDHVAIVTGGTSGDERKAARTMVSTLITASAMASSLTRSYGTMRTPR